MALLVIGGDRVCWGQEQRTSLFQDGRRKKGGKEDEKGAGRRVHVGRQWVGNPKGTYVCVH